MTPCGIWWTLGIIALCIIGVVMGEARPARKSSPTEKPKPRKTDAGTPCEPSALVFRRGAQKIVRCHACTDMRRGYTVSFAGADAAEEWSRTIAYEKKALACALAEQALAQGGITFKMENGMLHAELRAIIGEAEQ